ncbi:MAG: hypothetical protein NTY53_10340 [Kiritimatiellaeota bacterium]|nr:hypothetical protein [Kiritimatiellota bacterium]
MFAERFLRRIPLDFRVDQTFALGLQFIEDFFQPLIGDRLFRSVERDVGIFFGPVNAIPAMIKTPFNDLALFPPSRFVNKAAVFRFHAPSIA